MSSEYRPRRGGPRRSRGGRRHQGGPRRFQENTKKPAGFFEKLFGWLFAKEKPATNGQTPRSTVASHRPEKTGREERPVPAVNPEDLTTAKLYVGNLSYDTVESDLYDLFSQVGAVKNVEVVMDRNHNRSKGFGFVEMEQLETAKQAVIKFNRYEFMGRQLIVSGAKTESRERTQESSETTA